MLEKLRARLGELTAANQTLVSNADRDERDLTSDESKAIDENIAEIATVQASIHRREAVDAAAATTTQGTGRRTAPDGLQNQQAGGGRVPAAAKRDDPRAGFASFGEFAMKVRRAKSDQQVATDLYNATSTFATESVGSEGGYGVPPEFRREIWTKVMDQDNLLTRTDQMTTSSNNMTIPKDETTPWQTSGGIQVFWENEGGVKTPSKPALEMMTIRLAKLAALVPVSDELLEDAPGLESYIKSKAPQKFAAKINTAIVDGTGVGQPLGILRSASTISVAKETSQPADTIYFANIVKMWSRMYAPSRRNAIWIINQDIEAQLLQMSFDPAATAGHVPVYLGPTGLSASPYSTLMGRPVIPVEAAKTLGDKGDIILADLSQYMTLTKGSAIKVDTSMHLYFDQDLTAFRFVFRLNGQPAWGAAIDPQNGSLTRSAFVTLDERS